MSIYNSYPYPVNQQSPYGFQAAPDYRAGIGFNASAGFGANAGLPNQGPNTQQVMQHGYHQQAASVMPPSIPAGTPLSGMAQGTNPGMGAGMNLGMGANMGPGMGAGMGVGMGPGMSSGMGTGMSAGMGASQAPVIPGLLPVEQSYIENILRLNLGKIATFYMTYENNSQWNAKIFKGKVEAAGRDHIIISDPKTNMRILLLMVNLDYVTFDEELKYSYPSMTPQSSR